MRLASVDYQGSPRLVMSAGDQLRSLSDADTRLPSDVGPLLEGPGLAAWREQLQAAAADAPVLPVDDVQWNAPIARPPKILCVGRNYEEHARETGAEAPDEPVIFSKLGTTLNGHNRDVYLPTVSTEVDFEAELVVVIGSAGRNISSARAMDHVIGYGCGHDVSARDWQREKPGGQWLLGKSFDGFGPCGPWFVTADEVGDPHNLDVTLRLNGNVMQQSNTQHFIFKIPEIVSYISQVCMLLPGDVIFTGTPDGVGLGRKPPVYLRPGDVTEVEIGGLGVLRNRFVSANGQ